ncbi:hypothetical protein PFISCL1PPCAC_18340, partial [Pristionchus fissidentatus]
SSQTILVYRIHLPYSLKNMDEFSRYLCGVSEETPTIDSLEPSISVDTVSKWGFGIDPVYITPKASWSESVAVRNIENMPPSNKQTKRRSAECDKSMYAVFFRQQQPIVKALNPQASFGQISRLIAVAWEGVDDEQKKQFKVAAAAAKKEEMRRRIAIRTIQLCQGGK